MTTSEQNLGYFNRNPKELLRRFVTIDETWVHHYTPETRERSTHNNRLGKLWLVFFGMHME